MYQVNIQNQLFSAALPLKPLTAWAGSACSVTVAVPPAPALAGLGVSGVGVTLSLPDGRTVNAAAVQVAGTPLWVATFAADDFATSGHVAQGLMITIAGTDEHGAVRTWIIAKGDVDVMAGDAAPISGGSYYAVKLRDTAPENPVEGDAYVFDGALLIYHDGEWVTIGGADISSKLDGAATYPVWDDSSFQGYWPAGTIVSWKGKLYRTEGGTANPVEPGTSAGASDWAEITIQSLLAGKQGALSSAQIAAVNSGATAAKVATWDGYAATFSQKADATDLPYALVTPGEWAFSEPQGLTNFAVTDIEYNSPNWTLYYTSSETSSDYTMVEGSSTDLSITFGVGPLQNIPFTATRASLPGHLIDRAGNRVEVSGDTTLTLPDAVPGYLRDFLVRLEISGSTVPTITFAAPTGETIVYETDGDEFPVPDEAGDWLYSFTESCVAHKFAVSLKKVNEVAQGGS